MSSSMGLKSELFPSGGSCEACIISMTDIISLIFMIISSMEASRGFRYGRKLFNISTREWGLSSGIV